MGIAENIYHRSPVIIQNLLITLYGLRVKNQRYGSLFHETLRALKKSAYLSEDEIENLQREKLADLVIESIRNVPAYSKYKELLDLSDPVGTLEKFPVLEKSALSNNKHNYVNNKIREYLKIFTSGSTGTPLTIEVDKPALQVNYAFFWRFLNDIGITLEDRGVTFAGRKIIPDTQKKPPYWRHNHFMNNMLFSSYHISEDTVPEYIRALEKYNPSYIDSYPSAIYQIAEFINRKNMEIKLSLKGIVTSSETLLPYQREQIEKAFKCKVYDQYGAAEMCIFAFQCEHGTYHVCPEYCYVEVIDDEGNSMTEGKIGDLICTGFLNKRMPMIRYRIGDTGKVIPSTCKCGRKGQVISSLEGRKDDVIITPEGNRVGRLDPIYKGLSGIKESQIVQTKLDEVVVYIVKGEDYIPDSEDKLRNEMKLRLGNQMNVKIEYTEELQKTASGKFRSVISLVER